MQTFFHVFLIVLAYLIGSVPTSVWVGRHFFDIDIREHGSGNAGATNTIRVLGLKTGLPVLFFDVFKGWLAVNLIHLTHFYEPGTIQFVNAQIILGLAAVLGHIFPVYVGFRGGKGVATLLGLVLAIQPVPTLIALAIFIITLFVTKYVSLSSIMAGISFPVLIIAVFKTDIPSLVIFSLLATLLLILTHRKNIGRLIRGEEAKAKFIKSKRHRH